jgi:hypothetical protein
MDMVVSAAGDVHSTFLCIQASGLALKNPLIYGIVVYGFKRIISDVED